MKGWALTTLKDVDERVFCRLVDALPGDFVCEEEYIEWKDLMYDDDKVHYCVDVDYGGRLNYQLSSPVLFPP